MKILRRVVSAVILSSFFCFSSSGYTESVDRKKPMVVVISLDAFGYESLRDPYLPAPTLRSLMQSGVYTSMQPINPTVTWPNHTAMVTGVNASRHHVLVNGLIVDERSSKPIHVDAEALKTKLVAVPTVYDVAQAAGLATAEVDWVAIYKAQTINWSFAESPDPQSVVVKEMLQEGKIKPFDLENFSKGSQAWRDNFYTDAAVDIIKKHHPNLLLVHLLALDGIEHKTGYDNDSGKNTIAYLDDRVRDIMNAVREAGDLERTTFLIVSDHGQQSYHHRLHPNVLLREAKVQGNCIPEGGSAMVYLDHATPENVASVKALFTGKPGVRSVLTAEEAAKEGYPLPSQSGQGPDVLIFGLDDYAFVGGDSGEFVTEGKEAGAHGYPKENPLMQEIFIASGRDIRKGGEVKPFPNVNVAAAIAHLLGVKLNDISGQAPDIFVK